VARDEFAITSAPLAPTRERAVLTDQPVKDRYRYMDRSSYSACSSALARFWLREKRSVVSNAIDAFQSLADSDSSPHTESSHGSAYGASRTTISENAKPPSFLLETRFCGRLMRSKIEGVYRDMIPLRELDDNALVASLRTLVGTHRRVTAELLQHLGEIEERRIHLLGAYPSLFEYCLHELKFSEDEAYRRIAVARLGRR